MHGIVDRDDKPDKMHQRSRDLTAVTAEYSRAKGQTTGSTRPANHMHTISQLCRGRSRSPEDSQTWRLPRCSPRHSPHTSSHQGATCAETACRPPPTTAIITCRKLSPHNRVVVPFVYLSPVTYLTYILWGIPVALSGVGQSGHSQGMSVGQLADKVLIKPDMMAKQAKKARARQKTRDWKRPSPANQG